eukprot:CAMPEP_0177628134 /NCGR_PEP_ID=MMETSP0419_2-20121207/31587_1 /TAXON_ID=582737 /ORGANISM="Tetraselmis sp., Strain GSL018" /LENGTH=632 /DNA_ID=CAMNT_0019129359 /DNA_START=92 /DNA_END=1989 /DNA_ORIENTATION=+
MTEVNLHVYDVTNTAYDQANHFIMRMNNLTRDISVGGLFHGAVEVYGREWSFGFCEEGSGVYACIPKLNRQYTYRETVPLGRTKYCQREVNRLLRQMRDEWQGDSYDLLSRNCCHFCEEFCKRLGLEPLPRWLNRFATGADSAINAVQATCNQYGQAEHTTRCLLHRNCCKLLPHAFHIAVACFATSHSLLQQSGRVLLVWFSLLDGPQEGYIAVACFATSHSLLQQSGRVLLVWFSLLDGPQEGYIAVACFATSHSLLQQSGRVLLVWFSLLDGPQEGYIAVACFATSHSLLQQSGRVLLVWFSLLDGPQEGYIAVACFATSHSLLQQSGRVLLVWFSLLDGPQEGYIAVACFATSHSLLQQSGRVLLVWFSLLDGPQAAALLVHGTGYILQPASYPMGNWRRRGPCRRVSTATAGAAVTTGTFLRFLGRTPSRSGPTKGTRLSDSLQVQIRRRGCRHGLFLLSILHPEAELSLGVPGMEPAAARSGDPEENANLLSRSGSVCAGETGHRTVSQAGGTRLPERPALPWWLNIGLSGAQGQRRLNHCCPPVIALFCAASSGRDSCHRSNFACPVHVQRSVCLPPSRLSTPHRSAGREGETVPETDLPASGAGTLVLVALIAAEGVAVPARAL